jgi:glycine cleavage system H protein
MSNLPPADRRYTDSHLWLKALADGSFEVGATDEGQSQLGDMVFVDFAPVGKLFTSQDPLATLESVKAASDMLLPASGSVIANNPALTEQPELINADPYGTWVVRVSVDNLDTSALLDAAQYRKRIGA